MSFSKSDKNYLKSCGYTDEEIADIDKNQINCRFYMDKGGKKINFRKAEQIAGSREAYLSGLARSLFHITAYRNGVNYVNRTYFIA